MERSDRGHNPSSVIIKGSRRYSGAPTGTVKKMVGNLDIQVKDEKPCGPLGEHFSSLRRGALPVCSVQYHRGGPLEESGIFTAEADERTLQAMRNTGIE